MKTLKRPISRAIAIALWAMWFQALGVPRAPLPPLPEPALLLHRLDFDAPYYSDTNRPACITTDNCLRVESWSGYALDRNGNSITPLAAAAVDSGHTNVGYAQGAVRFWFTALFKRGRSEEAHHSQQPEILIQETA